MVQFAAHTAPTWSAYLRKKQTSSAVAPSESGVCNSDLFFSELLH
jgi:hypothetical protein